MNLFFSGSKATGYILIKAQGLSCEKLINFASRNNIKIWDIKRISYTCIVFKTQPYGLVRLKSNFKSDIEFFELKHSGIPAGIKRATMRKALFFGSIISLLILVVFSSFIWQIRIVGASSIPSNDIKEFINSQGIKAPMPKRNTDFDKIEQLIEIEFGDIFWANFTQHGILLDLEVVESKAYSNDIDYLTTADVVALKDGYITKVLAFKGNPIVSPNTTVKKGDVIIEGEYFDEKGNYRFYKADGLVYADIWYMEKHSLETYKTAYVRTGKSTISNYIEILGAKSKGDFNGYEYFEQEILSVSNVFKNLGIPIKRVEVKYYQTKPVKQRLDIAKIKKDAYKIAYDNAKLKLGDNTIIDEKVYFSEKGDYIEVVVFLKTNEDIADIIVNDNFVRQDNDVNRKEANERKSQ